MTDETSSTTVIPRLDRDGTPVLFITDAPANYGNIVCYAHLGQHSEASVAYYRETKPAKRGECDGLLREYASIPPKGVAIVRRRLTRKMLKAIWR
jgi:hypothetical protein